MLLLSACGGDDAADDEAAGTETETAGTETTNGTEAGTDEATTTTADTTTEETTDPTTEETTDPTTEETTDPTTDTTETTDPTTDTTDSTDTTTGGGGLCEPAPGDDACTACLKGGCCDELLACFGDEDCACVSLCIQGGGNPFGCGMECGVMGIPPELQQLGGCSQAECANECG